VTIRRLAPRTACAIFVLLAFAACSGASAQEGDGMRGSIEATTWQLTTVGGRDVAAAKPRATLRLEGSRAAAFAGCNRMAGGYTIESDRLTLGPLAGTMMACPEPQLTLEGEIKAALEGTLHFRVEGTRLTLARTAGGTPVLVYEAAPPPRLDGVSWHVTGYNNGRQAVVSPVAGSTPTLEFRDGTVAGDAGCNRFHGSFTQQGDTLAIGPLTATKKACTAEGVMEQEQAFLAALVTAKTWTIDERGMLDVHRGDGERVLTASPNVE
jgi:heat shock protein HslJ